MQTLKASGAATIDMDAVGHAVYAKGQPALEQVNSAQLHCPLPAACSCGAGGVRAQIRQAFGDAVLGAEGEVDRKKLGPIVFASKEQVRQQSHDMRLRARWWLLACWS
jgi:dephospho-CoA kinase